MYKLYGERGSGSCMIEAALAQIGAPVEVTELDFSKNEQRGAGYRAVNPAGKVPALVLPSGQVLTESAAILIALAERHPETKLLPPLGSDDRALALRWLIHVVSEIYPWVEVGDYPERFVYGERERAALKERSRVVRRERWLRIEHAVSGDPWLLESGLSIADLAIANVSRWSTGKEWRAANLPKIERIYAALLEQPRIGPVWRRHAAGA